MQDGDVLGGHQATGRVLAVGEQFLDVARLVLLHLLQQLLRPLARHVGEQVRHLVGGHRLQDVRGALDIEPLEDRGLHLRLIDLFQRIRGFLVIEGGEDGTPVVGAELVDDVGDVGRMELGELGMGDPKLDRADVGLHGVDGLPGDELLRPVQPERRRNASAQPLEPDPARQPATPDIDADDERRAFDLGKLKVVDPHHPAAVHVDDLLVEDLPCQPQLGIGTAVRL